MAVFALNQESTKNSVYQAVSAGLKMLQSLKSFNGYLGSRFDHEFKIGIGTQSGIAIIGNLGYRKKKEFTAIGDTVNTALRISKQKNRKFLFRINSK